MLHPLAIGEGDELVGNLVALLLEVADARRKAEASVEVEGLDARDCAAHLEVGE